MKGIGSIFLVVFFAFMPFAISAETIAVLDFKPIGVDPALVDAAITLLRADLSSYKKFTLIEKHKVEKIIGGPVDCDDKDCALEIGDKINAEKVVYGTISKLGEKYIIAANVVKVSTKQLIFQDRISATSAEDLDVVSKRLAKAIVTGKKVEKTAEVGAILEEETKEPRRRTSFYTAGGKFGWGMPLGGSYADAKSLMCYDAIIWYETQKFIVEVQFGLITSPFTTHLSSTDTIVTAAEGIYPEISIFYLFTKSDFCPYAGGGMGMRHLMLAKKLPDEYGFERNLVAEASNGLGLNLNAGLIAFRTYDFRIVFDTQYSLNLANLGEEFGGPHHLLKISFGITYKSSGGGCGGMGGGCGGMGGGFGGGCL